MAYINRKRYANTNKASFGKQPTENLPPNEEAKGDKQESDGGEGPDSDLVDDLVLIANIFRTSRRRAYAMLTMNVFSSILCGDRSSAGISRMPETIDLRIRRQEKRRHVKELGHDY